MAHPESVQFVVAWMEPCWVLMRNAAQLGAFAGRDEALAAARSAARSPLEAGADCSLLVRDQAGDWREEPC